MSKNEVTELNEELNKIQDELKTLLMDTLMILEKVYCILKLSKQI